MAISVKGLRWLIVGVTIALVAALIGLVGYGKWKARSFLAGLPRRLGISLLQETENVTYSQSYRGRTIFTVHAARQIQHADGKYTLKDVGIVLYGKDGGRTDRIRGQEFEYDQKHGVLTAVGEVYLDLAGPGVAAPGTQNEARVIHVKTSGLVYLQKEQRASTDALTEFTVDGYSGQSVGATYAGESGTIVLNSQVRLSGLRNNQPMVLTASRAEMDRVATDADKTDKTDRTDKSGQRSLVKLEGAKLVQQTSAGAHPGVQTAAADHALVHGAADGHPERVEAEGHVVLTGAGRGVVTSQRLDLELNDKGAPRMAHLAGGVLYRNEARGRIEHGVAADARIAFDPAGQPMHAVLVSGVALDETAARGQRSLNGDRVEFDLNHGRGGRTLLRGAVATATDVAVLRLTDLDPHGVKTSTTVRAARLTGRFDADGQPTGLDGAGKTYVERDAPGLKDTSVGDVLRLDLRPGTDGRLELARAAQNGSVQTIREAAAKKPGAPDEVERAHAAAVLYDAATDVVTLTGGVQVADATSVLLADRVTANRTSGDGTAEGGVRVSYLDAAGQKGSEPIHVIAARAISHKTTGITDFFAAAGARARMWQAGSAVEASVLEFDRTRKIVIAKDGARAVLVGDTGQPVRITGPEMTYNDAARTVVVAGPVRVDDVNGTMTAREGTVYLLPATASASASANASLMGGKVDRVVGVGSVVVTQPGRKATGERLVYTAADETFVLTGSPRLTDAANGTVTGSSIRFKRGDESVLVSGEGGRVRTETRIKQ